MNPRKTRRGANAIEFALTLPVMLLIVSGLFDWSWLAWQRTAMKASVTAGCRAASLIDPGIDDRDLDDLVARGREVTLAQLDATGGPSICAHGCDVDIDVVGAPPSRIVRCSVSGRFDPVWGMYVRSQGVGAADLDRLAWQRWPTRS